LNIEQAAVEDVQRNVGPVERIVGVDDVDDIERASVFFGRVPHIARRVSTYIDRSGVESLGIGNLSSIRVALPCGIPRAPNWADVPEASKAARARRLRAARGKKRDGEDEG
jgi:hypothetical protein